MKMILKKLLEYEGKTVLWNRRSFNWHVNVAYHLHNQINVLYQNEVVKSNNLISRNASLETYENVTTTSIILSLYLQSNSL